MLVDAFKNSWLVAHHVTFLIRLNLNRRVIDVKFFLQELSDLVESVTRIGIGHDVR